MTHHHLHHVNHHHYHHPRLNPHQYGLDDRVRSQSNSGVIPSNGGSSGYHFHHHNNNNPDGTELQSFVGGSSVGSGSSVTSGSHFHHHSHNNNLGGTSRRDSLTGGSLGQSSTGRKVSFYACLTQNGPAHRICKGSNNNVCNADPPYATRTTYC